MTSARICAWQVALLLALCGVSFFPYLGSAPFFDKGEAREAVTVQDIVRRGEWWVPLKGAESVPSKPPLFHWSAAVVSELAGRLNEVTVRFASAFYATLGVLIVYFLARQMFNAETGLLSGAILATTLVYQDQAVDARVDMTLCFFVTLSLALFYSLYRGFLCHPLGYYFFFTATGIGTLAKGPLGLLLPGLTVGSFLLVRRRWDLVATFALHPGVLLMVVLAAAWYVTAVFLGGSQFFDRQILEENLSRFAGGSGHSHPIYYYFPYLFSQGLPWSLFLPLMLWDVAKRASAASDNWLFLMVWVGAMFVFFSVSMGKRPVYLLPLYPALSILLGAWLVNLNPPSDARLYYHRTVAVFAGFTGAVIMLIALSDLWGQDTTALFGSIEQFLKPKDRANFLLVRSELTALGWPFTAALVLSGLLWCSLARSLWLQRLRAGVLRLILIVVISAFMARSFVIPKIAEAKSYRQFMNAVNQVVSADDELYLYGRGFNSDQVNFYRGEPVPTLDIPLQEVIGRGNTYLIMAKRQWLETSKLDSSLSPPLLESLGRGPEGDAPLVLLSATAERIDPPTRRR